MIRYTLRCSNDHEFDGWFRDSAAFDAQTGAGEVACPMCGDTTVGRALMAPSVSSSKQVAAARAEQAAMVMGQMRQAMVEMRKKVEESCDYVGDRFPEEARRIHYGEVEPEKPIYGESTLDEARELLEEGIDVLPIPGPIKVDA